MELSARGAGHDFVGLRLVRLLLGKQRLHVHPRSGASKYDHGAHGVNIGTPKPAHFDPDQTHNRRQRFLLILGTPYASLENRLRNVPWSERWQISPLNSKQLCCAVAWIRRGARQRRQPDCERETASLLPS
jgi:hypothetical protein